MDARSSKEITCYQCGLPLRSNPRTTKIGEIEESFCCAGCFIVYKITGTKGDEGLTQALLGKFGVGVLFSMNVMMISALFYGAEYGSIKISPVFSTPIRYILLCFSMPVIILLGYPLLKSSIESLKQRILGTEALILIGAVSAFAISVKSTITGVGEVYFEISTMILTLYTCGRYLDTRARFRASESIKGLSALLPSDVIVLRENNTKEKIALSEVKIGDQVILPPGEIIPLDGIVIDGYGSINESFLTGESKPVYKSVGNEVFSGTLNINANIIVEIRKSSDEFVIKRIERLMERIRGNPSRIKRIADKITAFFIPLIVSLSLGSALYWLVIMRQPSTAIMRMLSILLISCPCAFGIAAPLAIWKGLGEGAKRGVIIMGADILEILSRVKTIFFDKTGTLTLNTLSLSKIYRMEYMKEDDILQIAALLESHFKHPLSSSILDEALNRGLLREHLTVTNIESRQGMGIEGEIQGKRYYIGSKMWFESLGISTDMRKFADFNPAQDAGILVYMAKEKELIGCFSFTQTLRHGVKEAFEWFREQGIRTVILTGDGIRGGLEIEKLINPDEIKWGLLPEDKVREIEAYKAAHSKSPVAMVGDGINDAPALESAHIGIAMGCGTELTRESAKINLLGDDITLIAYLVHLSKKVRRKIQVNFFWAFIYNLIGIGFAVNGTISPLMAVLAMILSSLFVIGNSIKI
ncbi:MAG: heavy metal translocating P-type ATPase [Nitrospirae bacterium]|nr:heavy metal translocating P-type ATPase [Nitrospirota bacterium]